MPTPYSKHIGKTANLKLLQTLANTPDSGWYFEDCLNVFSCTFTSLQGCQAENPPRIRVDFSVDRRGVILDISSRVQLWKDSPPTVGYSNCGAPPVGVDLKQVHKVIKDVLVDPKEKIAGSAKESAKKAKTALLAKKKLLEQDFRSGLENHMSDDPAIRKQAIALITKSADSGHTGACRWLSAYYCNGEVPVNQELCLHYLQKALEMK